MKKNIFNEITNFLQNLGNTNNTANEITPPDVNLSDINDDAFIDDVFLAAYNNTSMKY